MRTLWLCGLIACTRPAPPSDPAPTPRPAELEAAAEPARGAAAPAPAEAGAPANELVVVANQPPWQLSAPSLPRIAHGVVTVADLGDDRYAMQNTLVLRQLDAGAGTRSTLLEVFGAAEWRRIWEATDEATQKTLEPTVRAAAAAANARFTADALGPSMPACTVTNLSEPAGHPLPCAEGQQLTCGALVATFTSRDGTLRHAGGSRRNRAWKTRPMTSKELHASWDLATCIDVAFYDAASRTLAARFTHSCVGSVGDWCSEAPGWDATRL